MTQGTFRPQLVFEKLFGTVEYFLVSFGIVDEVSEHRFDSSFGKQGNLPWTSWHRNQ